MHQRRLTLPLEFRSAASPNDAVVSAAETSETQKRAQGRERQQRDQKEAGAEGQHEQVTRSPWQVVNFVFCLPVLAHHSPHTGPVSEPCGPTQGAVPSTACTNG